MRATQQYTIAEWASKMEREAACSAVLRLVWPNLSWFDVGT